jgi:hypothetical protein
VGVIREFVYGPGVGAIDPTVEHAAPSPGVAAHKQPLPRDDKGVVLPVRRRCRPLGRQAGAGGIDQQRRRSVDQPVARSSKAPEANDGVMPEKEVCGARDPRGRPTTSDTALFLPRKSCRSLEEGENRSSRCGGQAQTRRTTRTEWGEELALLGRSVTGAAMTRATSKATTARVMNAITCIPP